MPLVVRDGLPGGLAAKRLLLGENPETVWRQSGGTRLVLIGHIRLPTVAARPPPAAEAVAVERVFKQLPASCCRNRRRGPPKLKGPRSHARPGCGDMVPDETVQTEHCTGPVVSEKKFLTKHGLGLLFSSIVLRCGPFRRSRRLCFELF